MMPSISQALFEGDAVVAQSPSFSNADSAKASELLKRYAAVESESLCVFSLSKTSVGIVQARGSRFRILALDEQNYQAVGDPFAISRHYPPNYEDRGPLADLEWDVEPQPRTLEQLRTVLKSDDGPSLLGAAQALVDGGRVVFERPAPDIETIERLWLLLPDSARGELRLATFALNNELGFDLLVAPKAQGPSFADCLTDSQAADYPQGQYELNLQIAVEAGDEAGMSRLLARRSGRQALRLMLTVLVAALFVGLASRVISHW